MTGHLVCPVMAGKFYLVYCLCAPFPVLLPFFFPPYYLVVFFFGHPLRGAKTIKKKNHFAVSILPVYFIRSRFNVYTLVSHPIRGANETYFIALLRFRYNVF